jgi:hypothetical protein
MRLAVDFGYLPAIVFMRQNFTKTINSHKPQLNSYLDNF